MAKDTLIAALIALALVGMSATYQAGAAHATFSIARSCALENRFDQDGVEFYCGDVNDYHE